VHRDDASEPRARDAAIAPALRVDAGATDAAADAEHALEVTHADGVSLPAGAIVAYAARGDDAGQTDLYVRLLDSDGRPRGSARRVRHVRGEVTQVATALGGARVWIGYAVENRDAIAFSVMNAATDLSAVTAPVVLAHFRSRDMHATTVRVAPAPDGSAIVLYPGRHISNDSAEYRRTLRGWSSGGAPSGMTEANWFVARVSARRVVTPLVFQLELAGRDEGTWSSALSTPAGASLLVADAPGAFMFGFVTTPQMTGPGVPSALETLDDASALAEVTTDGLSQVAFAEVWDSGRVLTIARRLAGAAAGAVFVRSPPDFRLSGPAAELTGLEARCEGGRLLVHVTWTGGDATIDPGRPDAGARLGELLPGGDPEDPDVWAGRALVAVRSGRRRVCGPGGTLIVAPP
jgi:hypothetical protein